MDSIQLNKIKENIISFQIKIHPAWNENNSFLERIRELPLYFLEFNHNSRIDEVHSVTVTHYVPHRIELITLSKIINSIGNNVHVCDIGCGNGFIGSLLGREGVSIFGIDDHSYKQPQISRFIDKQHYSITEKTLDSEDVQFDVAFCGWMSPYTNLTPSILLKEPKLIIHIYSPDRQKDGSLITGTTEAYQCPDNYSRLIEWSSVLPENYFLPLGSITDLQGLTPNPRKDRRVLLYIRNDIKNIRNYNPLENNGLYYWDIERMLINQIRYNLGLPQNVIKVIK